MTAYNLSTAAFCLHSRPYRESSMIVQFFSEQAGRISAVVKGVKRSSKNNASLLPLFQPFVPIHVSLVGKSELKTVANVELDGQPSLLRGQILKGQALFAGLYINELLIRLLPEHIEHPEIYRHYQAALEALVCSNTSTGALENPLRYFERQLLENLGYGLPFVEVDEAGHHIGLLQNDMHYFFVPESGFVRCNAQTFPEKSRIIFQGKYLLQIANNDAQQPEAALQAKQLTRMAIAQLLGNKPLNSKMLFS